MAKKRNPINLEITTHDDTETQEALEARAALLPEVRAALTIEPYSKANFAGGLSIPELVTELGAQSKAISEGNLDRAEAMLTAQAHTLDAIFNRLAQRAIDAEYMNTLDLYLKLALRAQSQCRATWESLAVIKNPPVANVVKQANIAHYQQVNCNAPPAKKEPSRTRENQKPQNEVSGSNNELLSNTRASSIESRVNPTVEAMGESDRAENAGG